MLHLPRQYGIDLCLMLRVVFRLLMADGDHGECGKESRELQKAETADDTQKEPHMVPPLTITPPLPPHPGDPIPPPTVQHTRLVGSESLYLTRLRDSSS